MGEVGAVWGVRVVRQGCAMGGREVKLDLGRAGGASVVGVGGCGGVCGGVERGGHGQVGACGWVVSG